jgi:hypothetical protein
MRHNTVSHLGAACAHRPSQRPPWNCWLRSLGSQKKKRHFIKLSFDDTPSSLAERTDNIEATLVMAVASSRVRIAALNSAPPHMPIVGLGSSAGYLYLGPGQGFYVSVLLGKLRNAKHFFESMAACKA